MLSMLLQPSHNSSGKKKKRRVFIYFFSILYVDLRIKEAWLILMAKNFIKHMKTHERLNTTYLAKEVSLEKVTILHIPFFLPINTGIICHLHFKSK